MKSNLNIKTILAMAIIGIISFVFFNTCFAANTAKVNVDVANIRKTADANSTIVEQATKDQEVEILENTGDWYRVKYNRVEGYLRKDLVNVSSPIATENTATEEKQAESNANVTQPAAQEQTATPVATTQTPAVETPVAETTTANDVAKVEDVTGAYSCKELVKIKIMPLINGIDIKEVNQGVKLNVLEVNNKWALVESENIRGWVLVSKIEKVAEENQTPETQQEQPAQENEQQPVEQTQQEKPAFVEKTMYVNSDVINLRSDASTSSNSLAKLNKATEVTVIGEENGWSKVKVNGKEGYVASRLLSSKKPEVTTSRSTEESRPVVNSAPVAENTPAPATSTGSATGSAVVDKARTYIGSRYVYGGTSPSGFDCSGFAKYVYGQFGVNLNRTAAAQYSNGTAVSRGDLQVGDLVMFGNGSNINHVGIYAGNGTIVHAANPSRGVTTDTINSGYYNTHYIGARRIVQ
ncbi:MAG: C40 family peptidase [Clostridia bacterium]|nr:C40 family peptidase [Clostridia bacterium]MBP3800804.1 C40 family peptidase [Clostridia bacterium]